MTSISLYHSVNLPLTDIQAWKIKTTDQVTCIMWFTNLQHFWKTHWAQMSVGRNLSFFHEMKEHIFPQVLLQLHQYGDTLYLTGVWFVMCNILPIKHLLWGAKKSAKNITVKFDICTIYNKVWIQSNSAQLWKMTKIEHDVLLRRRVKMADSVLCP